MCSVHFNIVNSIICHWKVKKEVRRKKNFTYVLGFVMLRDVAKVFGSFLLRLRERWSGGIEHEVTRGMTRPKDEMGSQIVSSESDISHPILVYLSRNNNCQAQARRFPALTAPEPEFSLIFGSKWDLLTSTWRQGGASPEKPAELPTVVSPLQKRIWKWDFRHCSSCNFFFHICFCHLWCELPL